MPVTRLHRVTPMFVFAAILAPLTPEYAAKATLADELKHLHDFAASPQLSFQPANLLPHILRVLAHAHECVCGALMHAHVCGQSPPGGVRGGVCVRVHIVLQFH